MKRFAFPLIILALVALFAWPVAAQINPPSGGGGGGVSWKGTWAAGTNYKAGETVSWTGGTYVAIAASPAGTLPSDVTKWAKLGSTGAIPSKFLDAGLADVTTADPTRGDIVTAQGASPKWARLAKGTQGYALIMGANEPGWASVPATERIWLPLAYCYGNGTCGQTTDWNWNGYDSGMPTFGMISGGTSAKGAADFSDTGARHIQTSRMIPSTWDGGTVTLTVNWFTSVADNTKSAVWQARTACSAADEVLTTAFGTAATVTSAAHASTLRLRQATITLNMVGCAAGEMLVIDLLRDPAHASDNLGSTASAIGVLLAWTR